MKKLMKKMLPIVALVFMAFVVFPVSSNAQAYDNDLHFVNSDEPDCIESYYLLQPEELNRPITFRPSQFTAKDMSGITYEWMWATSENDVHEVSGQDYFTFTPTQTVAIGVMIQDGYGNSIFQEWSVIPVSYSGQTEGMVYIIDDWYYLRNGVVDWEYTGMASNEYGWWYFEDGSLNWTYTGMACNEYGWWYYRNGNLDWNYTGMACNEYGWWYYQNGRLDWNYTGMANNEYGWWYYQNGRLDWNYTGMANNEYGWWYYQNGRLDWTYTGMACNEYGWWYYQNGRLDWTYTGFGYNEYGTWLYYNGQIAWGFTGDWNGHYVVNGHVES
ncbi:MAG: hypothetical protein IJ655_02685 [Lachnospiraceae bacterium]|nr:hypothetical protein [Lachnospiraceae bacterium]